MKARSHVAHLHGTNLSTGNAVPVLGDADPQPHQPERDPDRPILITACAAGNQYGRMYQFQRVGQANDGHAHRYDHHTWLVAGGVRVECDGTETQEYWSPCVIIVPAEKEHKFTALADNTIYICTHQLPDDADTHEEPGKLIQALISEVTSDR